MLRMLLNLIKLQLKYLSNSVIKFYIEALLKFCNIKAVLSTIK